MLQEKQGAIVHARQSGSESAREAELVVLPLDFLLLLLPIYAERRVGKEVVESIACELVLREAIAKADIVAGAIMIDLLHQHIGGRCGEGALVVILPVDVKPSRTVMLTEVILSFG
jgi:hypothetical protein